MRWVLISKKQLLDKEGDNDGVQLLFKSGKNEVKYVIHTNSVFYNIGEKYICNLKFKKETQNTLGNIVFSEDEDEGEEVD
ncbi:MAG: hypothetical protein ACTSUI_00580 [Promethearchaeota archaeon]